MNRTNMSIKLRLRLSYIAMLVIPIILSFLAIILISSIYARHIEDTYSVKFTKSHFKEFMDKGSPVFLDVKLISSTNIENLQDMKYINELSGKLSRMNTGIIIRKNDNIIYSSPNIKGLGILKELPSFGSFDEERRVYADGGIPILIKQHDFYFKDQSTGSIFLIIDTGKLTKILMGYVAILIIVVLFIMTFTCAILTYFVSRSIIKPLDSLKYGANQIKDGNLSFQVNAESKDEIGELCNAFEEMRLRLKESVDIQLQYEDNRKQLISNISHDLKTPVTAIKGYIEGIRDGVADTPQKMDKYIKTIYSKTGDMDKLINELFLYSKLDLKKVPFNFENVEIKSYLEDSLDELKFDLEKKNIEVNLIMGNNKPVTVIADREKLKRVITNIVDNSVKYMNVSKGKIVIVVKEEIDAMLFEIRDNGQGMEISELPHIFERFYRADPSRNTLRGGSGLGLSISKHIIEEHGGKIWAESEPNQGTSIFFTLKKQ